MKCIIKIDRKGIDLSPAEINNLLREIMYVADGIELDKYNITANFIKIYIFPKDIEESLCGRVKDALEMEMKRILERRKLAK